MKPFVLLFCLTVSMAVLAQDSGMITYDQTTRLEIKIEGGPPPEMMKDMPKQHTIQMVLVRKGDEVLFQNKAQTENENDMNFTDDKGMTVHMKMGPPQEILYTNLTKGVYTEQRDFLGKKFLIKDKTPEYAWKLTGKSKQILDYPCQEAVLQDTSRNVVAWFTPMIPWQIGPGKFSGLPGLILEVIMDDGQRVLTASEVNLGEVAETMEIPTKGKEVSQKEYDEIVAEKMKEMGGSPGSGGQVHMIIRQN